MLYTLLKRYQALYGDEKWEADAKKLSACITEIKFKTIKLLRFDLYACLD